MFNRTPWIVNHIDLPFIPVTCNNPARTFKFHPIPVSITRDVDIFEIKQDEWNTFNKEYAVFFTRDIDTFLKTGRKLSEIEVPFLYGYVALTMDSSREKYLEIVNDAKPDVESIETVNKNLLQLSKTKLVDFKYEPGKLMYSMYVCSRCLDPAKFNAFEKLFTKK